MLDFFFFFFLRNLNLNLRTRIFWRSQGSNPRPDRWVRLFDNWPNAQVALLDFLGSNNKGIPPRDTVTVF